MVKRGFKLPVLGSESTQKELELPKEIFALSSSPKLLAQYVRVYLARFYRPTSVTKTRSEVQGSTRKIYRQKGTGRARHGDIKAPIFVGGGIAHGPVNVRKTLKINKKMRRKALFVSLSEKLKKGNIFLLDDKLIEKINKTKMVCELFSKILNRQELKDTVLVLPHSLSNKKYFQNIDGLLPIEVCNLNAYLVLKNKTIIFTVNALDELKKRFIKEGK